MIILEIAFPNFPHDLTGVSHGHHIGGDILGYHASRANYAVIPDGYPWENHGVRADPDIISDMYGHIVLGLSAAQTRMNWMRARGYRYFGGRT